MADPDTALLLRMEASLSRFEKQMAGGRKVARETAVDIEKRFDQMGNKVGASADKAATGIGRIVNLSSNGRFVLQNTAAQLGDIAVQLESGTKASTVMAQQLPQILGGFGSLRGVLGVVAPILGVIAAVGVPVAAVLWEMARSSEEAAGKAQNLNDKIKSLAEAQRAHTEASEAASAHILDLRKKYGEYADEVQRTLDIQREMTADTARSRLNDVVGGIGNAFGVQGTAEQVRAQFAANASREQALARAAELSAAMNDPANWEPARYAALEDEYRKLAETIQLMEDGLAGVADRQGITIAQMGELAAAAAAVREASSPEQQIAAMETLRSTMVEVFGSTAKANEQTGGLVDKINTAIIATSDLVAQTSNIAGGIAAGTDEAARLAGNLNSAAREASKVANSFANQFGSAVIPGDVSSERLRFGSAESYRNGPRRHVIDLSPEPTAGGGGRSRGGAGRTIDAEAAKALAERNRLYESTRTSTEKYADEQARLNELYRSGAIDSDLYKRALDDLAERFDPLRAQADQSRDAMKSLFVGVLTDIKSADQLLGQFLLRLAEMAATRAFNGLPSFGAGGSGGLLGGFILPGILHNGGVAGVSGYAHGRMVNPALFVRASRYHSGGIAGLRPDEVPAILQRGERVIPKNASATTSGIAVDVGVSVDNDGNLQAYVQRVAKSEGDRSVRRAAPEIVGSAVGAVQRGNLKSGKFLRGRR